MELKAGHNEAAVGVIPEDWRAESLERCVRSDAPICYGILMPGEHCNHGVPVIKVRDIVDGRIDESNLLLTHPSIDEAYKRSRLRTGDVLITIRGTTGRVALVPSELHAANITQDTARLRINSNESNEFVYYALQSEPVQQQVSLHTIGQAVKGINIRDVKNLVLPLPATLAEQRAIAQALRDADALITALGRLIAKKLDLKQAAMQHLLTGKIRLAGFTEQWALKQIGDIADIVSGGTPKTSEPSYWNGPVQWCTPTDITKVRGKFLTKTERTITELGARSSAARILPPGTLLLCSRATIGECKIATGPMTTNQGFKNLICRDGTDNLFLYYKLLTIRNLLLEKSFGSTFLEISKANLSSIEIDVPEIDEQLAVARVLSDMDDELDALEARLTKTREIKQGMMQQLMTGKVRLT